MDNNDIDFIPERLNRIPTVYRGMTIIELAKITLLGVGLGFIVGLIVAVFFKLWVFIVIGMLVMPIPTIIYVSGKFSKLKRGRPDTWLTRHIELKIAQMGLGNPQRLLFHDEYFITSRKNKRK